MPRLFIKRLSSDEDKIKHHQPTAQIHHVFMAYLWRDGLSITVNFIVRFICSLGLHIEY